MRPGVTNADKNAVQIITRYMCRFCGRQFDSMSDMENHTQMHFSEKPPHSCYVCGRTYRTPSKLQRHVRVHSGERPYSCQICSKRFTRSDHVKQHMKVHLPQCQKNVCRLCGMRFMRRQTLQAHLRSHGFHQVFSCNRCGEAFESAMQLHQHKTTHEPDSEQASFGIKQEPESPDDTKPIVGLAKFGLGPQPDVKETIDGNFTTQSNKGSSGVSKLKKILTAKDRKPNILSTSIENDIEVMARCSALHENGDIDAILRSVNQIASEKFSLNKLLEPASPEVKEEPIAAEQNGSDATHSDEATGSTLTDGNRMIVIPPTEMDESGDLSDNSQDASTESIINIKVENGVDSEESTDKRNIEDMNSDDDIIVSIIPRTSNSEDLSLSNNAPKLSIGCLPSVPRLMRPIKPTVGASSSSYLPMLKRAVPSVSVDSGHFNNHTSLLATSSPHLSAVYVPSAISSMEAPICGRSSAFMFGKKMLRCDHCSIWFEDQSMSMLHMSLHSADETDPFTCKKCLKRLGNRLEFMAHIVWHLDPLMDEKLQGSFKYI